MTDRTTGYDALRFVVFKLNVQTIFNADLHLDGIIAVWRHAV
jgi:hypothetical protein